MIDDDVERRMRGGIRHRDVDRLKREIEAADLDDVRRRITEEELEAARDRRDELDAQVERCRGLLERSRGWVGFEAAPFRQALPCALELLGAEPLARSAEGNGGGSGKANLDLPGSRSAYRGPTRRGRRRWIRCGRRAGATRSWPTGAGKRRSGWVVFKDAGVLSDDTVHLHRTD